MDRPTLPSADPSTVWLVDLIEATEVVAASAEPCDPAIVKAFSHRLELRADVRPRSALSRWPVAELDQGEEPQPSPRERRSERAHSRQ